jgi:hypothetical protein
LKRIYWGHKGRGEGSTKIEERLIKLVFTDKILIKDNPISFLLFF